MSSGKHGAGSQEGGPGWVREAQHAASHAGEARARAFPHAPGQGPCAPVGAGGTVTGGGQLAAGCVSARSRPGTVALTGPRFVPGSFWSAPSSWAGLSPQGILVQTLVSGMLVPSWKGRGPVCAPQATCEGPGGERPFRE